MKTRTENTETETRMLDVTGLSTYIGLGKTRAMEFAERVGAKRRFGKRVLYDKKVIDKALDELPEE